MCAPKRRSPTLKPLAGYSQTPLLQKLGIKHGTRLALVHAPDDFAATLGALPPGVELVPVADGADVIVAFPTSRAEVEGLFLELKPKLAFSGGLWIAWPKKSSGIATDLSEDPIREIGLAAGWWTTRSAPSMNAGLACALSIG
jgi:hypothetical protein